MKKIIPLVLGLFLFLPLTNAFALEGGLMDGKMFYFGSDVHGGSGTFIVTNRNIGDGHQFGNAGTSNDTLWYSFGTATDISSFKLFANTSPSNYKVTFYNSSKVPIGEKSNPSIDGSSVNFNISDAWTVSVENLSGAHAPTVYEFDVFGPTPLVHDPVTALQENHTYNSASLTWTKPVGAEFTGTIIKKDGVEVTQLANTSSSYTINGLDPETTYNFEVIAKYSDGINSTAQSISVTTDAAPPPPEPAGEVIELVAEPTHERVDLSWQLPESENLKHVNIYRDTVIETSFIDSLLGVQMVYAAETKIFETNGTYFNDLTVEPETTYEYTLTTTSTEAIESEGVTTQVTTLETPPPEIIGGDYEEDPTTGDFTYSWLEPSTGQVKIMVGGTLYKTVSATDKQVVIPKSDMKYTPLGDPNVSLIAVAEDGKESVPVSPGMGETIENVKVPFSASDLLSSGTSLLFIVGPFVLLALAFLLVPKLRGLIVNAFSKKDGKENARRSTTDIKTERTTEPKEQREKREKASNTVDFKGRNSKEKVIVKVERTPKERRVREPKPSRAERKQRERISNRRERFSNNRERASRPGRGG